MVICAAAVGAITSLITAFATELFEQADEEKKDIDVGDILIPVVIGATEGALMAMCPTASIAISAGASAAESAIIGARDYLQGHSTSAREIIVDTLISGAFGAVVGVGESAFSKTGVGSLISNATNSVGNAIKKGIHPVVKKKAKKLIKEAVKHTKNAFFDGLGDYVYTAIENFTSWYTNSVLNEVFEK